MAFLQCFIVYKTLSHLLSKWMLPEILGDEQGEYYYYPHFTNEGFESWTWDFCRKSFPSHLDCSLITIIPNTLRAVEINTNKFTLQVEKAKCVCWEKWEQSACIDHTWCPTISKQLDDILWLKSFKSIYLKSFGKYETFDPQTWEKILYICPWIYFAKPSKNVLESLLSTKL